ncbi:hypothetical protein AFLA_001504 [Aspergillus flavus NRRL3357]|nr:hypothetical protein AFLA_001504 [Aspergillus flavus NRRL3357]
MICSSAVLGRTAGPRPFREYGDKCTAKTESVRAYPHHYSDSRIIRDAKSQQICVSITAVSSTVYSSELHRQI